MSIELFHSWVLFSFDNLLSQAAKQGHVTVWRKTHLKNSKLNNFPNRVIDFDRVLIEMA